VGGRLEETYKLATLSKSYMDFVKVIIWDFRKLDAVYKTLNDLRILPTYNTMDSNKQTC
jgi:hypothetical protein